MTNRRLLEIIFLAMVVFSAIMLGLGQESLSLPVTAIVSALVSWLLVDFFRWFRLPRWMANVLSIGVLIFTMSKFFDNESGAQLIAVANLLVYLQSLLLFQEKTPRQYWQLIVLNLLQIVVAAVFILDLEGGLIFLIYMVLAAFFLFLLTNYDEQFRTDLINQKGEEDTTLFGLARKSGESTFSTMRLQYQSPAMSRSFFLSASGHLIPWIVACLTFAIVLFVLIPREQEAWFASRMAVASQTGISKSVQLDVEGRIQLNGNIVMRASFSNVVDGEPITIEENPYFRGLALSKWTIRDNVTTWLAPYDRVYAHDYEPLEQVPSRLTRTPRPFIHVDITLEPTRDPMIYAIGPAFAMNGLSVPFEECAVLGSVTRARNSEYIEQTPYPYRLLTRLNKSDQFLRGFPYEAPSRARSVRTLEPSQGDYRALTELDPERYPRLVEIAASLAERYPDKNSLQIATAIEQYFLNPSNFQYTLDYTTVPRDRRLDPVEDFVRNHHQGHCEMFASAMVLMLRSLGIPARLVVGYCGGENAGEFYSINNMHAHAWLEAYIPPEFCTEQMREEGSAGPGGSWYRFDPTPPSGVYANSSRNASSLTLARSLWQDYVLGLDDSKQVDFMSAGSTSLVGLLDIGRWSESIQESVDRVQSSPLLQLIVILISLLVLVLASLWTFWSSGHSRLKQPKRPVSLVKRWAANALALISPSLGNWLLADKPDSVKVPFYERYLQVLRRQGWERAPAASHLEFAAEIESRLLSQGADPSWSQRINRIVNTFQLIRFGKKDVPEQELRAIEADLKSFEQEVNRLIPAERVRN